LLLDFPANIPPRHSWQTQIQYNSPTDLTIRNSQTLADGSTRWLDAERAVRLNGAWTFYNVSEQKGVPGTNSLLVPSPHAKMLAMPQFSETPEQIRSEIKLSKSLSLDASKRTELPILEILNYLHLHRNNLSVFDSDWLYTTLHGRLAAPWACLVVVLIAMPFGAVSGRRNIFVGVAGSIVICFIYYVLLKLGLAFGTSGWVPAWLAAWFPNLSFAIAGLWMTARVR